MSNNKNDNLIIGINLGDFGSTGNIMLNSLEYAHNNGPFDVIACIPYESKQINRVRTLSFSTKISRLKHYCYAVLRKLKFPIINDGNYYKEYTIRLINIIKQESKNYKNTIIHMHNMHMCNLDVNKFYKWLGSHNGYKVLYTLHDCWTFTGGCYYYSHIKCNKWLKDCKNCPQHIKYSTYQLKHRTKLLNKIKRIQYINVSFWGDKEFKKSRIGNNISYVNWGETPLEPFNRASNLKEKLNIIDKKVLLFVSAYWNDWKGVKYIYQLAEIIPSNYIIIVVGSFDKKEYKNIINVGFLDNKNLAEYYAAADVYLSITQAEQLGLTTCEAQICGTPVVMFGHGGSKETIIDGKSGLIIGEDNDIEKMANAIIHVVEDKPFKKEDILASGNRFKKYEHAKRMLDIYKGTLE